MMYLLHLLTFNPTEPAAAHPNNEHQHYRVLLYLLHLIVVFTEVLKWTGSTVGKSKKITVITS